ncbi:uncharacterized protein LOC119685045 [Teleopsis dalmanni]|uniref:uncharacterized protein LOC119685045 n=1 Tax=Teleopsis dalmanni TaxID=139649 RepID=UPI0018CF1825|nr:uncharacterized protein LOC119685045 [Teleopsis dalmanni]
MAVEVETSEEMDLNTDPVIKPVELKNIGFLQKQSTFINCVACGTEAMSVLRLEPVTCLQRFLNVTKLCKNWERSFDINHYCSKCGCYIGRFVPLNRCNRYTSNRAREKSATDSLIVRAKQAECAESFQKVRNIIKEETENFKENEDQKENVIDQQTDISTKVAPTGKN